MKVLLTGMELPGLGTYVDHNDNHVTNAAGTAFEGDSARHCRRVGSRSFVNLTEGLELRGPSLGTEMKILHKNNSFQNEYVYLDQLEAGYNWLATV